jgi:RNA polymerase sigma-70 factor (ECF subfamily)
MDATRMSSLSTNTAIGLALRSSVKWMHQGISLEDEVLSLFDLMRARLLRYAVSFGITVQDGEDIVQETFLALFHHLRRDRSRENLHGWLFRVTHNLALKRRMKILGEPAGADTEELEILDPKPNPEEHMLFSERHARLASVLQALSIEDQSCLRLRAEGFRYREIASIVGISLGSVSASLSRSLARLEQVDQR